MAVQAKYLAMILHRVLRDDQIGNPNAVDAFSQTLILKICYLLPADIQRRVSDGFEKTD